MDKRAWTSHTVATAQNQRGCCPRTAARAWDIDAVGSWTLWWRYLPVLQLQDGLMVLRRLLILGRVVPSSQPRAKPEPQWCPQHNCGVGMEPTEALLWELPRIHGKVGSTLGCGHPELSFKTGLAALASVASPRLSAGPSQFGNQGVGWLWPAAGNGFCGLIWLQWSIISQPCGSLPPVHKLVSPRPLLYPWPAACRLHFPITPGIFQCIKLPAAARFN